MARSSEKKSARKSLTALVVLIIGLGALVAGLTQWGNGQYTPRLGLDLQGGTEIVLEPVLVGNATVTSGQITQAVDIIRQRIDANGVAEAEISTLGGTNIAVAIPGTPTPAQLEALRKPSQLRFRAVFVETANAPGASAPAPVPTDTASGTATGAPSGTASESGTPTSGTPAPSPTAANAPIPDALRAATSTPAPTTTAGMVAPNTAPTVPTAPSEESIPRPSRPSP